jgi:hypothetical protein
MVKEMTAKQTTGSKVASACWWPRVDTFTAALVLFAAFPSVRSNANPGVPAARGYYTSDQPSTVYSPNDLHKREEQLPYIPSPGETESTPLHAFQGKQHDTSFFDSPQNAFQNSFQQIAQEELVQQQYHQDSQTHPQTEKSSQYEGNVEGDVGDKDAALPEGWTQYFDSASGLPYYHNHFTGDVTWDRPMMISEEEVVPWKESSQSNSTMKNASPAHLHSNEHSSMIDSSQLSLPSSIENNAVSSQAHLPQGTLSGHWGTPTVKNSLEQAIWGVPEKGNTSLADHSLNHDAYVADGGNRIESWRSESFNRSEHNLEQPSLSTTTRSEFQQLPNDPSVQYQEPYNYQDSNAAPGMPQPQYQSNSLRHENFSKPQYQYQQQQQSQQHKQHQQHQLQPQVKHSKLHDTLHVQQLQDEPQQLQSVPNQYPAHPQQRFDPMLQQNHVSIYRTNPQHPQATMPPQQERQPQPSLTQYETGPSHRSQQATQYHPTSRDSVSSSQQHIQIPQQQKFPVHDQQPGQQSKQNQFQKEGVTQSRSPPSQYIQQQTQPQQVYYNPNYPPSQGALVSREWSGPGTGQVTRPGQGPFAPLTHQTFEQRSKQVGRWPVSPQQQQSGPLVVRSTQQPPPQPAAVVRETLGSAWQGLLGLGNRTKEYVGTASTAVGSKALEATQSLSATSAGKFMIS